MECFIFQCSKYMVDLISKILVLIDGYKFEEIVIYYIRSQIIA